jgi:hypothetical protein
VKSFAGLVLSLWQCNCVMYTIHKHNDIPTKPPCGLSLLANFCCNLVSLGSKHDAISSPRFILQSRGLLLCCYVLSVCMPASNYKYDQKIAMQYAFESSALQPSTSLHLVLKLVVKYFYCVQLYTEKGC